MFYFFFSSRRRHTRWTGDWSSDVCSSDLDRFADVRSRSRSFPRNRTSANRSARRRGNRRPSRSATRGHRPHLSRGHVECRDRGGARHFHIRNRDLAGARKARAAQSTRLSSRIGTVNSMMTLAQFVELLDIHGADPARWPDPSREAAQELLAANADARAVLAGAADFDVLIARHYRRASPHAGARSEEQAMVRVLARLEASLPPQRRGLLPRLLPAALLEFDLAPAWPRFAALV